MSAREEAIGLKNKGNEAFKFHDWPTAVSFYSQAIEKYNQEPSFYTNRAQAHIRMEAYGFAVADATKALELDPDNVKVCSHTTLSILLPITVSGGQPANGICLQSRPIIEGQ